MGLITACIIDRDSKTVRVSAVLRGSTSIDDGQLIIALQIQPIPRIGSRTIGPTVGMCMRSSRLGRTGGTMIVACQLPDSPLWLCCTTPPINNVVRLHDIVRRIIPHIVDSNGVTV